jgi:NAD(P)-dependent dehydrogenase (short-subunit alcohol dehydrogenase family)
MTEALRVLVTGSAGGLGRALIAGFSSEGWSVIGVDRAEESEIGPLERYVAADLSTEEGVVGLVEALEPLGHLDAIVNNAAFQVNLPLLETSDQTWRDVFQVNLDAPFRLIRWAAPYLAERGGAIVNIGSVHSVATSSGVAAYAVSKGALAALTRTAALELAPLGVRCNAVLPGAISTPMLLDGLSRRGVEDHEEGLREIAARTPLGRVAHPEEIVPTVIHLADGRRSGYLTGQAIVIDGGASLGLGTE